MRTGRATSPRSLLRALASCERVQAKSVLSAFAVTDFTLVGGTPLDVLRECEWTWICTPPPLGPDIHANTDGYGVIAHAFEQALP